MQGHQGVALTPPSAALLVYAVLSPFFPLWAPHHGFPRPARLSPLHPLHLTLHPTHRAGPPGTDGSVLPVAGVAAAGRAVALLAESGGGAHRGVWGALRDGRAVPGAELRLAGLPGAVHAPRGGGHGAPGH